LAVNFDSVVAHTRVHTLCSAGRVSSNVTVLYCQEEIKVHAVLVHLTTLQAVGLDQIC